METAVKSCSEDSCLAFDLLNADDPSASDCPLTPRSRRRPISKSFDSDTLEVQRASLPPIRQRLLRSIHHELSLLAAEADGVSEKVKVGWYVRTPVVGIIVSISLSQTIRYVRYDSSCYVKLPLYIHAAVSS